MACQGAALVVLPEYQPASDAHHPPATAVADGEDWRTCTRSIRAPYGLPRLYPLLLSGGTRSAAGDPVRPPRSTSPWAPSSCAALLAWRLAGRWRVTAGALASVFAPLVANDAPPLGGPLGLALLLATLLLLEDHHVAWAGVTTGLMVLTRPSGQFCAAAWLPGSSAPRLGAGQRPSPSWRQS